VRAQPSAKGVVALTLGAVLLVTPAAVTVGFPAVDVVDVGPSEENRNPIAPICDGHDRGI
jgi:hypothetical protein